MITATKIVREKLDERGGWSKLESVSLRFERFADVPEKGGDAGFREVDSMVRFHNEKCRVPPAALDLDTPVLREFVLQLGGRLVLNLAGGVIENAGITLHRHWGCPYIPGSSLKGIARVGAEISQADRRGSDRENLDDRVTRVFGSAAKSDGAFQRGSVIFFDAFPATRPTLVTDIVNCHHPRYYSGDADYMTATGGRALDNENPIPNYFPAVEIGTCFVFRVALTRFACDLASEPDKAAILDNAQQWLRTGLMEYGVGGKISAGYGWFHELPSKEDRLANEVNEALSWLNNEIGNLQKFESSVLPEIAQRSETDQRYALILLSQSTAIRDSIWKPLRDAFGDVDDPGQLGRRKMKKYDRYQLLLKLSAQHSIDLP